MGIYNTYGNTQLKCGTSDMTDYQIGDKVDLDDGLYLGWDGFIAVKGGILIAEWQAITDTHSGAHNANDVLKKLWEL